MPQPPVVVVGAGFFGLYIAEHLARRGRDVLVLERSDQVMGRASFANQARVHNGCHYPRSVLTALRCRVSFPRFVDEFKECIHDDFDQYYLIGRILGKVTAHQFSDFCERIGVALEPAPDDIVELANPHLVEAAFRTDEVAFHAPRLAQIMEARAREAGVRIRTGATVTKIQEGGTGLTVSVQSQGGSEPGDGDTGGGQSETIDASDVFVCTYSMINPLLWASTLEPIPFKHEVTELCLVDVPDRLKRVGFTVMCGPFFSVMPFPSSDHHSFSHVRYTPHFEWMESAPRADSAYQVQEKTELASAWTKIRYDARRYIPLLDECVYQRSLWETKTTLPRSEVDDSRPILFRANHGLRGLHCVMGGKIDNIYDALALIEELGLDT